MGPDGWPGEPGLMPITEGWRAPQEVEAVPGEGPLYPEPPQELRAMEV